MKLGEGYFVHVPVLICYSPVLNFFGKKVLACIADINVEPQFVMSAKLHQYPCSGLSRDSMIYRKNVLKFFSSWLANQQLGILNRPIMASTQSGYTAGGPEKEFGSVCVDRLNQGLVSSVVQARKYRPKPESSGNGNACYTQHFVPCSICMCLHFSLSSPWTTRTAISSLRGVKKSLWLPCSFSYFWDFFIFWNFFLHSKFSFQFLF